MNQLTQKELIYLHDALNSEANEVTKFTQAANTVSDTQAKTLLKNIAGAHQSHFDTLKRYIDTASMH